MNTYNKEHGPFDKFGLTDNKGKPFIVPKEGSLGLLALGYKGLMAWREARGTATPDIDINKDKNG